MVIGRGVRLCLLLFAIALLVGCRAKTASEPLVAEPDGGCAHAPMTRFDMPFSGMEVDFIRGSSVETLSERLAEAFAAHEPGPLEAKDAIVATALLARANQSPLWIGIVRSTVVAEAQASCEREVTMLFAIEAETATIYELDGAQGCDGAMTDVRVVEGAGRGEQIVLSKHRRLDDGQQKLRVVFDAALCRQPG
ncbi:MAG: hypothetical protein H0U74_24040 [Bradymonadaceae bacterium]|nr:hypothetical protein [Lujinxingiaceae bacterium]